MWFPGLDGSFKSVLGLAAPPFHFTLMVGEELPFLVYY